MADGLLVGIDVGTTSSKAVVLGVDGAERGSAARPTPWDHVPTGAEARPETLLDAVLSAVHQALGGAEGRVVGVGVTSMAETGVLLDGHGRAVAPAIAWNDKRAAAEGAAMRAELGADEVARRTGLTAGPKLTAATYRWLARNDPGVRAGRRWLGVAEWVVHALGGDAVAEASLASRTGWLDLDRRDWWRDALAWSGADERMLGEVRPAGSPMGVVSGGRDGLAGAVLTVAGHDHLAATVGAGAMAPGDVLDSCGTAEAFVRAVPAPLGAATRRRIVGAGLSVGWHVIGGHMAVVGGFRSGDRLQRLLEALGTDRTLLDALAGGARPPHVALSVEDLDTLLASGGGEVIQRARAVHGTGSPAQLWRAAAEAVARHGAQVLDRLEELTGPRDRLVVVGGWAKAGPFAAAKEALLAPLVRPDVAEAGARGAALLAGVAAGVYPDATAVPPPASAASIPAPGARP